MLTKKDVKAFYDELYGKGTVDVSLIGVELLGKLEEYAFDLNKFEAYIRTKETDIIINNIYKREDSLLTNLEPYFFDFKKVLYCSLEDVPLCVNGKFSKIANWRLNHAT